MTGKTHKLNWKEYKEVALEYDVDPYEFQSFGIDLGGGDSEDFECIDDDPPEREE